MPKAICKILEFLAKTVYKMGKAMPEVMRNIGNSMVRVMQTTAKYMLLRFSMLRMLVGMEFVNCTRL